MSEDSRPADAGRADGYNAGYAEQLYERSLRQRGIVPPALADWLEEPRALTRAPAAEPARLGAFSVALPT